MPITSIELTGFKPLNPVAQIKKLTIVFTERLQLLLGSNGVGKSAVMGELTPLPADKDDYYEGGSKLVHYDHLRAHYVLRSTMSATPRHSFLKDGEELNKGGTQSVQKELVLQHFGITTEIRDLLLGRERFTEMEPRRRREWYTKLAEVDYDYALGVFNRLRKRANEISGALKDNKKRLVVEQARIIPEVDQVRLRLELEALHTELEILRANQAPLVSEAAGYANQYERLTQDLNGLSDNVLRLKGRLLGLEQFDSPEALDATLEEVKHAVTAKSTLLAASTKHHEGLQKQFDILKQTGEAGLADLKARMQEKRTQRDELLKARAMGLEGMDPDLAISALNSVRDVLVEVFIHLPSNSDRTFSRERNLKDQQEQERLMILKDQQTRQYAELVAKKQVMESHKAMGHQHCPNCGHKWINGYSDERMAEHLEAMERLSRAIDETDKLLVVNKRAQDDFHAYLTQYMLFSRTVKAWPVLQPFWDFLLAGNVVVDYPRKAQGWMETLEHDLQLDLAAKRVQGEINEQMRLIEQAAQLGDVNLISVQAQLHDSEFQIQTYTRELTAAHQEQQRLTVLRRHLNEYQELGNRIEAQLIRMGELTDQRVEALRREVIHEQIRQTSVAIGTRAKLLDEVELQKRTVAGLEFHLEELQLQAEATKLMIDGLSPTDGLIADGLLGSIQNYTASMNGLIKKIWTYPFEILPCGTSTEIGAELDYKFPLYVNGELVPDIKRGSTGQREVIDLSFRVVATTRLGLIEPQLMLDEFGAGLDYMHQRAAASAIQHLVDSGLFSQVFMVSHYEASYGALTQSEIAVLCPDNIVVPHNVPFNQHVTIEN
jgi:hypothetical protein